MNNKMLPILHNIKGSLLLLSHKVGLHRNTIENTSSSEQLWKIINIEYRDADGSLQLAVLCSTYVS